MRGRVAAYKLDLMGELDTQSIAHAALEVLSGFSKKTYARLVQDLRDDPMAAWENVARSPTTQKDLGATSAALEKLWDRVVREFEQLGESVYVVNRLSSAYPSHLKALRDAPFTLFVKGDLSRLAAPGVSVVGARNATDEGKRRAARAARILVDLGYSVVSGLAKGIDTAAHTGALQGNGHTVGVIGTPIDRCYPAENQQLQDAIAMRGTLVSQFSPVHPVNKFNFPTRNATMSGLTLATIIVEASETSGALIQARHCLSQRRLLFIMQNQIDKTELKWPKSYLEKGARALRSVEDLEHSLAQAKPALQSDGEAARV